MVASIDKKVVLVFGDIMVDASWLVKSAGINTTSQFHGNISARNLIDPTRSTDMLGGAGTLARRIASSGRHKAILVGAFSYKLFQGIGHYIPENIIGGTDQNIDLINIPNTILNDHMKLRVYEYTQSGKTELVERYDRDSRIRINGNLSDDNKAKMLSGNVIIATDFNKGLFNARELLDFLKHPDLLNKPFLLRTKRIVDHTEDSILKVNWSVLFPNREDLPRCYGNQSSLPEKVLNKGKLHPFLFELLREFSAKTSDSGDILHRYLLVKLDSEGAILFDNYERRVHLFQLSAKDKVECNGVSAGDILISEMAKSLCENTDMLRDPIRFVAIVKEAIKVATYYCNKIAGDISRTPGWYGRVFDFNVSAEVLNSINFEYETPAAGISFNDLNTVSNRNSLHLINDDDFSQIDLNNASWFSKDFLTTDVGFLYDMEKLKTSIKNYLHVTNKRPFVTAICGRPGAGKSTLARALKESFKCDYFETNVAQWNSLDDMNEICEKIRTSNLTKEKPPIVFIDEVDAKVNGENVFSKLLSPLWEAVYFWQMEKRNLGDEHPAIFILAGSNEDWESRSALLKKVEDVSGRESKLIDLISRFSMSPIDMPKLFSVGHVMSADALYIVAKLLKNKFPEARLVERRVLWLLTCNKTTFGIRSIEQALHRIKLYVNDFGAIDSCMDDLQTIDEAVRLHVEIFKEYEVINNIKKKHDWRRLKRKRQIEILC